MSKDLRKALGLYATGVTVVMTNHGGMKYGLTCNSFASVSLDPPLVLWSIQRSISSYEAFTKADSYTVNVLGKSESDLAMKFAKGTQEERFNGIELASGPETKLPRLANCLAWFECKVEKNIPAGDHDIMLGRVLAFDTAQASDEKGLLFFGGRFGHFTPDNIQSV